MDALNPFAGRDRRAHGYKRQPICQDPGKNRLFEGGMGMGLLFTTAEPDQLHILGSWLNELSGGRIHDRESNLFLQRETAKSADAELRELRKIVSELVALLNGKNILDDSEGMSLLRKLAKKQNWTSVKP